MNDVAFCRIHPAIGVARLGDSPSEFFLGPETPLTPPRPEGGFKDAAGRMKRQAARFRIFGYGSDGRVVREITAEEADIQWSVHVANTKGAWYRWLLALDLPQLVASPSTARPARRNGALSGGRRNALRIDPGPRRIGGRSVNSGGGDARFRFDTGSFLGTPVALGEARTDAAGRLVVLGGFGRSEGVDPGSRITDRANNDRWFDDVADGPVTATVILDGKPYEADSAWVVCAPPDFAPAVRPVVSGWDVVRNTAVEMDPSLKPLRPSFRKHLYPLFEAFGLNQWVNLGFLRDFGWMAESDPLADMDRLRDPTTANRAFREAVFARFRDPDYDELDIDAWPGYFGDGVNFPGDPREFLAVTPLDYTWLRQWAAGDFVDDWPPAGDPYPDALEDVPLDEQPEALDRAALERTIGGSFNPGHELPFVVRLPQLYRAPFRIRQGLGDGPVRSRSRQRAEIPLDFGPAMDPEILLRSNGPLSRSGPGALTQWMPLPWQADASTCRFGFGRTPDPYLPAFWPASLPNHVLTWETYQRMLDPATSSAERAELFRRRALFYRSLPANFLDAMNEMARSANRLGVLTEQPAPEGESALPARLLVETGNDHADS